VNGAQSPLLIADIAAAAAPDRQTDRQTVLS